MQVLDSPAPAADTPTPTRTARDTPAQPPRLLDQLRAACRVQHFSLRTEQAYAHWVKRFVLWSGKRHPATLGGPEVEAFLTYLATERDVSASTQRQALSALLFLYRQVLGHSSPVVTERVYAHLADRDLRQGMQGLVDLHRDLHRKGRRRA